jgi:4-amino-4-deoxy-L-arabinose transferase-like glycosyltransferase
MIEKTDAKEGARWWQMLAIGTLPLLGFWLYGLFDLDEGYYAAVVAEMNRRGEWITPYFNGKPWFEKPILLYWLAKPSVSLFGEMVGPRLPSVLATVGLLVVCGWYLRKRVSLSAGIWAMGMLGTSLIVIAIGRMMITDAVLDLCICAAFLSFYESLVGNRNWRILTAFCLGLAVLAKGPVSLPLFLALAVWTYVSEKDLRPRFRGGWLLGILVLFATVSLWYVPAYLENGQIFIQKFFIEQNLQRFSGGDEAHKVPLVLWPFYYPVILFAGLLPWSIWIPRQWWSALAQGADPFPRYLARWGAIILIFFTTSGTKLPHYILPAVPPIIMLGAICRAKSKQVAWKAILGLAVGFCILANAVFILWYQKSGFAEVHADARTINQMVKGRGAVITYQLARVANSSGLALNDTSNPSLGFYLDQNKLAFTDCATFSELEASLQSARGDLFVLTRPGRLTESEVSGLKGAGFDLELQPSPASEPRYQLYRAFRVRG